MFVNYAHRGASEYCPENTFLSFYTGIFMGANGIETDVQKTRDGILVLFHDDTVTRLTGAEGSISDYTLEELQRFVFTRNGLSDKIVVFEDFLRHFACRDLRFAIEIKQEGYESEVADLIRKYNLVPKCTITSFIFNCLRTMRQYAPEIKIGYLTENNVEEGVQDLLAIGGEEICPESCDVSVESVRRWHQAGLNVRAWGVKNEQVMHHVFECGADGMTVNFPDKLTALMNDTAVNKESHGIVR